ncbi:MAG TPA: HigA family addiction module antitoxin [Rhizomicrobium sp.]|jgi:addiction module HigA family antidote|nr:HigA family addiction module antitoxin [Rhizomicrobium sp.]
MSKKAKPNFTPPSPGETLKDYILGGASSPDRITQDDLAGALDVSRVTVNQIINGRRAITAPMALKLSRVLRTSPEFWLNLQNEVDLEKARRELGGKLEKMPVLRGSKNSVNV